MYYLRFKDDKHGRRWKVREAVSVKAAVECIWHAMATGSIGGKDTETVYVPNDGSAKPWEYVEPRVERVLADVVRVNPDNTEVHPC